jgi:putative membrane protein
MVKKTDNNDSINPIKKLNLTTIINIILLLSFTVHFMIIGSYEFLLYAVTLFILIYLIEMSDKFFNYSNLAKGGFTVWLLLHLAGGGLKIAGTRIYDIILIDLIKAPYHILKYDQMMHMLSFFVMTLFVYSIILSISDKKANKWVIILIAFLGGLGIGAINEVIEFVAVIFFDAAQAVGDYYNTALDLVFNTIGALAAVLFASKTQKKE